MRASEGPSAGSTSLLLRRPRAAPDRHVQGAGALPPPRLERRRVGIPGFIRTRPGLWAVAVLFGAGIGVRLWFLASYRPAFMGYSDSQYYVRNAAHDLFQNGMRPAGYPLFLRLVHSATDHLSATIALQHFLGVAAAGLFYLALRRLGTSRPIALVPAVPVLFDGAQIFLEHAVLSDAVFTFLVATGAFAAIAADRSRGRLPALGWAVLAGAALGSSATVRPVGLAVLPVVAAWLLSRRIRWRWAALSGASAAVAAAAVLGGYLAAENAAVGAMSLTRGSGWDLYARVARFADCSKFTPPAGTRALCERTAPALRPDASTYIWKPTSPAEKAFGFPPSGDSQLRAFAWAAIRAQPWSYAQGVGADLLRYAVLPDRRLADAGLGSRDLIDYMSGHAWQGEVNEKDALPVLTQYYRASGYTNRNPVALRTYGRNVQIAGTPLGLLAAIALAGAVVAGRGRRRGPALFLGVAVVLLFVPVATLDYEGRYGVPAYGPLAAAAALGARAAYERWRARRPARRPLALSEPAPAGTPITRETPA